MNEYAGHEYLEHPLDDGSGDALPVATTGARVFAGIGGLLLVVLACVITGGFAVASFVGMGVAALVCRARHRPYTRAVGLASALFGAVLAFAAIFAFAFGSMPRDTFTKAQQQMVAGMRQPPPSDPVQRTIDRVYPGSTAIAKAQSDATARAMSRSPALFWGAMAFGLLFAAGFIGAFVSGVAWGSATVLLYGVLGRWPSTSRAARVTTYGRAHDVFDEI